MSTTNQISLKWLGQMAFEGTNPSGITLKIDASPEDGGEGQGYRPKALMLSSLAGCSGLDVAALIRKMKLEVEEFNIEVDARLTESHPRYYNEVSIDFHFHGPDLNEKSLKKAVNLSVEKYCGVMEMFRSFAKLQIRTLFHKTA